MGQCDLNEIRNKSINNLSLGAVHTSFLYNEGYVVVFGEQEFNKFNIQLIQNNGIIKVALGGSNSGFL